MSKIESEALNNAYYTVQSSLVSRHIAKIVFWGAAEILGGRSGLGASLPTRVGF